MPWVVCAVHLLFLASIVLTAHHPVLFIGLFLLFMGFVQAYKTHQSPLILKEALLVVRRGEVLPQVLDSAVLDLEQGENAEVARLNGYLHAIVAFEPKPDSAWLQLTFRFVDQDADKMNYLSRLIAHGTAQKHFVPGA